MKTIPKPRYSFAMLALDALFVVGMSCCCFLACVMLAKSKGL